MNKFLEDITTTDFDTGEVTIDEMIDEGENGEIEFKSSMRWSYQREESDKKLEIVVMKTIAGLSNSDGGTLLIGVQDDGEILGLDKDFNILGGNVDKFELHVRNLLNKHLGKVSAAQVNVSFPIVRDKEICRIDVLKSDKPVYLKISTKEAGVQEKFYVRSGNSTQELSISEASEYIQKNLS